MSDGIVKTIRHESAKRRVDIFRRGDGSFGFQEWYFSEHPDEQCWVTAHQQMTSFMDTQDAAEREARARVDWLAG